MCQSILGKEEYIPAIDKYYVHHQFIQILCKITQLCKSIQKVHPNKYENIHNIHDFVNLRVFMIRIQDELKQTDNQGS